MLHLTIKEVETIQYLKLVKDSNASHNDWWHDLSDEHKAGIERGLGDVDDGNTVHRKIIDDRLLAHKNNPNDVVSWEDVKRNAKKIL